MIDRALDIAAAVFALVAALFWFLSAARSLPPMRTYWNSTPETDPYRRAMRFSVSMNRWAALFSGLSAACVGAKLFFDI